MSIRNMCTPCARASFRQAGHPLAGSQGINSVRLDESLLELMHKSGMYRPLPDRSGSAEMLRFIRKPIQVDQ